MLNDKRQHKGWTHLIEVQQSSFCVPLSRGSNRLPPMFQAAIAVIRPRWVTKKSGSPMQEYSTFVESSRNSDDNVGIGQVAINAKLPTKNYVHDELRPCGTPSKERHPRSFVGEERRKRSMRRSIDKQLRRWYTGFPAPYGELDPEHV